MDNQTKRQRWWSRARLLNNIASWWERLPDGWKKAVKALVPTVVATWGASVTGALTYTAGVVREFWPLVILNGLAGVGLGAVTLSGLRRISDQLEKLARSQTYGRIQEIERNAIAPVVRYLPDDAFALLVSLRQRPRAITAEEQDGPFHYLVANERLVDPYLKGDRGGTKAPTIWGIRRSAEAIIESIVDAEAMQRDDAEADK